jgi:hypothetical protein
MRVTRGSFVPQGRRCREGNAGRQRRDQAAVRLPSSPGGVDRSGGTLVVVSTWDNEEAANFPREALGDAFERVAALGVQLEPPAIYEVVE